MSQRYNGNKSIKAICFTIAIIIKLTWESCWNQGLEVCMPEKLGVTTLDNLIASLVDDSIAWLRDHVRVKLCDQFRSKSLQWLWQTSYNYWQKVLWRALFSTMEETEELQDDSKIDFLKHESHITWIRIKLLGNYNRKKESRMAVAKRQEREKPMKIEQRKFWDQSEDLR